MTQGTVMMTIGGDEPNRCGKCKHWELKFRGHQVEDEDLGPCDKEEVTKVSGWVSRDNDHLPNVCGCFEPIDAPKAQEKKGR